MMVQFLERVRDLLVQKGFLRSVPRPNEDQVFQEVGNIIADREMFLRQREGRLELTPLYGAGILSKEESKNPELALMRLMHLSEKVHAEEKYERTNLLNVKLEGQLRETRGELEVQKGREQQTLVLLKQARKSCTDPEVGREIDKYIREHS